MKKTKRVLPLAVKVYFNRDEKLHMEIYNTLIELSKSMGVSLSTATGMALRGGVPLMKRDWDELQKKQKSR